MPGRRSKQSPPRDPYIPAHPLPGSVEVENKDGSRGYVVDQRIPPVLRRSAALEMSKSAAEAAASLRAELRERLVATDPIAVYATITALERQSRMLPIGDVYGYDALVDHLGGVVTSLPVDVVARHHGTAVAVEDVLRIDTLLRQLASAESYGAMSTLAEHPDQRHADARYRLLMEQQFDRMSGYTQHVRAIAHRILAPLEHVSVQVLGTTPLRALTAAEAVTRAQEQRQTDALRNLTDDESASRPTRPRPPLAVDPNGEPATEPAASEASARQWNGTALLGLGESLSADVRSVVSESLDLDSGQAHHLLELLTTPLGSQDVTTTLSPNRLQRFPVVPLPDGTFMWARPYEFVHDVLDWFDTLLVEGNHAKLRARYLRERARAAETITAEAFAAVFGHDRVHPSVEYQLPDGQWAETDLVIDLPRTQIVVEVKGHRITDAGRSGNPARVRSKIKELVAAPLAQSQRAREALLNGAARRDRDTQRSLPYEAPQAVLRCVVTLDRVDPFSEALSPLDLDANEHHPAAGEDIWMVCLADLLMVTTILDDPASLLAYLEARAKQTAAGSPRVTMESDALGAWIKHHEGAGPVAKDTVLMLEYSSDEINFYFTRDEMHTRHPDQVPAPAKPPTGVPPSVVASLRRLLDEQHPLWQDAASAVGAIPRTDWLPVDRDHRRLTSAPRTRRQRKSLEASWRGRQLSPTLRVTPGLADALELDGELVCLTVAVGHN